MRTMSNRMACIALYRTDRSRLWLLTIPRYTAKNTIRGKNGTLKYSLANGVSGASNDAKMGYCIIKNFPA